DLAGVKRFLQEISHCLLSWIHSPERVTHVWGKCSSSRITQESSTCSTLGDAAGRVITARNTTGHPLNSRCSKPGISPSARGKSGGDVNDSYLYDDVVSADWSYQIDDSSGLVIFGPKARSTLPPSYLRATRNGGPHNAPASARVKCNVSCVAGMKPPDYSAA